ncbi:50S ribosomal protein L25 [Candidatus Parcubacteria bacterium]|nr:50S ribosomal protein L25 [Candidatus Parcubacteria bacterium]
MFTLSAEIRKERAKQTRREGKIPAVLYGPKIENLNLKLNKKEFENFLKTHGEGSHFFLKVQDQKFFVIIKEIQRDPINDEILHVDFFQPSLQEKIEMKIPLIFEGVSLAVKNLGGILVKNISEIEVRGLLEDLPESIKVDISKLKSFEDKILVSDLKIPEKVEILRSKEDIVAFVAPPEKEELPPTEAPSISETQTTPTTSSSPTSEK